MNEEGVLFSSNWDIDQLVAEGEVGVTVAASTFPAYSVTNIASIPAEFSVVGPPVVDAVFKVGSGAWQQFGDIYFLLSNSSTIWIRGARWGIGSQAITVRYYIYSDKVNYT